MIPQPLTSDATVDLRLRVPNDWTIVGAGDDNDTGEVTWKTTLDRTVEVYAFPDGRTGIPGDMGRVEGLLARPALLSGSPKQEES